VREALQLATDRGVPLMEAPRPQLDTLTNGLNHQGLVLQVPPYEYAHPDELLELAADEGEDALIVALDGVTDPRNLGAVVRSVAAFGGHGVLVPERRAAGMTAGAWKTSAGAAARVPVAKATNLTRALEAYQKAGCFVVGLAADGEAELGEVEALDGPVVVVVGSEGKGLSRLVAETCDLTVRIPMPGTAESLNAGVAAGIVLYEASRRRR
jgi:23S rRNA (guanosine2251-2'-O)-methyltransferase